MKTILLGLFLIIATLIVGGWGGGLVGISSIDGEDASNNSTRSNVARASSMNCSIARCNPSTS